MNRILVIGCTGNVGRQVVYQLAATGARFRAMTRNPDAAGLPPQVDVVRGISRFLRPWIAACKILIRFSWDRDLVVTNKNDENVRAEGRPPSRAIASPWTRSHAAA